MNKRTPQEIADFFGCYVAMDSDGTWYMHETKPEIRDIIWVSQEETLSRLLDELIDWQGDWRDSLHCPQSGSFQNGNSSKKERKVVDYRICYSVEVEEMLGNGWELYGSPLLDEDDGYMQAMIKREE